MDTHHNTKIDHLVITAPDLAQGVAYVESLLGVKFQPGGSHFGMGTHNALLKLGDRCYLEVIAIEPGTELLYPIRWFELDELKPGDKPRLATWVASTSNLDLAKTYAPEWFGPTQLMKRGDLNWWITLAPHKKLVLNGTCPALIQWPAAVHPCDHLEDRGCSLLGLELHHPEARGLENWISQVGFTDKIEIQFSEKKEPPFLVARLQTPGGVCILGA